MEYLKFMQNRDEKRDRIMQVRSTDSVYFIKFTAQNLDRCQLVPLNGEKSKKTIKLVKMFNTVPCIYDKRSHFEIKGDENQLPFQLSDPVQ